MQKETPFISERLLRLLRCPMTGVDLELRNGSLVNEKFGVSYPVADGIPIMLSLPKRKTKKSRSRQKEKENSL